MEAKLTVKRKKKYIWEKISDGRTDQHWEKE